MKQMIAWQPKEFIIRFLKLAPETLFRCGDVRYVTGMWENIEENYSYGMENGSLQCQNAHVENRNAVKTGENIFCLD